MKSKNPFIEEFTWKNIDKAIAHSGYLYLYLVILCLIMMGGVLMNFEVMTHNDGKMPVKMDWNYSDDRHFSFQNDSEIEYPQYADIYDIRNCIYSLGDLVMLLAVILAFIPIIINIYKIYNKYTTWKTKQKQE
jgi:hypothetical protein